MLIKGWVTAGWAQSENNRRARYYRLTPAGKKQLSLEMTEFDRVIRANRQRDSACVRGTTSDAMAGAEAG
jgi:DNA-binding PadR family transcriptional regulator